MKTTNALRITLAGLSLIVAVSAYAKADAPAPYKGTAATVVDSHGNIHVPADYRTKFQMLGSWAIAADKGPGSKQIHVVYASPGTVTAYRKNGDFPDGTVLVKEVFKTTTKPMTTGTVSSADTLLGWFVMVKDSKGRFPKNKLWGDGWGWSWFAAANPNKTASTNYEADCKGCHVPAKSSDWIYVQGYPILK